jgi:hypothetical protein
MSSEAWKTFVGAVLDPSWEYARDGLYTKCIDALPGEERARAIQAVLRVVQTTTSWAWSFDKCVEAAECLQLQEAIPRLQALLAENLCERRTPMEARVVSALFGLTGDRR